MVYVQWKAVWGWAKPKQNMISFSVMSALPTFSMVLTAKCNLNKFVLVALTYKEGSFIQKMSEYLLLILLVSAVLSGLSQ